LPPATINLEAEALRQLQTDMQSLRYEVALLNKRMDEVGSILATRITNLEAKMDTKLDMAIKRLSEMDEKLDVILA
jgi:ribosomal protein S18